VRTKTPEALCIAFSQEKSNNMERQNFSPRTTSPIIGSIFSSLEEKYSSLEIRGLQFQDFVFLTSSKHTYSLWGWQEHQSDQCIHFISTEQLMHFDLSTTEQHTGYPP
jgi:hypothetical protein